MCPLLHARNLGMCTLLQPPSKVTQVQLKRWCIRKPRTAQSSCCFMELVLDEKKTVRYVE